VGLEQPLHVASHWRNDRLDLRLVAARQLYVGVVRSGLKQLRLHTRVESVRDLDNGELATSLQHSLAI
jgi:hypothetical protein